MKAAAAVKGIVIATAVAVAISLAGAGFLPRGAPLARPALVLLIGVKVALLALAAWFALGSRRRLEPGHPAVWPWRLLALGFAGLAGAHLVLGLEQLVLADPPYPACSDGGFILAQALLAAGLIGFVGAYRSSGLFPEEGAGRARLVVGVAAAVAGAVLLWTIAHLPTTWPARVTDGLYAVLDLAVLVPLALLVRQARALGGRVGQVWNLLLAGFVVFSAADITLGYLDAFQAEPPLLLTQVPFLVAYALAAAGSRLQLALLTE